MLGDTLFGMTPDPTRHLRSALVAQLRTAGAIRSDAVARAMTRVPRHLFVPEHPLHLVYSDRALLTKMRAGVATSSSSQPAIMAEMFPTRMRYSGVSLGYQVTAIVAGSWAPLIGTALLREYEDWPPIALYILVSAAISLVAALLMRETKGVSLHSLDEADRVRAIR